MADKKLLQFKAIVPSEEKEMKPFGMESHSFESVVLSARPRTSDPKAEGRYQNSRKMVNSKLKKGYDLKFNEVGEILPKVFFTKCLTKNIKQRRRSKEEEEEILFEIIVLEVFLKRLPDWWDIAVCKCVCKKWRWFLSTPEFTFAHRRNHPVTIDKKTEDIIHKASREPPGRRSMRRNQRRKKKKEKKKEEDLFRIIASEVFLKRLPERSDIVCCRGVCKRWRSFLSTPEFIQTHQQKHPVTIDDYKLCILDGSPPRFHTFSFNETIPTFRDENYEHVLRASLDGLVCNEEVFIRASLDGLVCVALRPNYTNDARMLFINPCTGAHKQLSPFPSGYNHRHTYYGSYAWLLTRDPIAFYIGDSSSDDYRLLCLPSCGRRGAFVYSRRSDSWKEIDFSVMPPHQRKSSTLSPAILCGQCLYFSVICLNDYPQPYCPYILFTRIICFDVKTETFREIPMPNCVKPSSVAVAKFLLNASLVVLDGCLHMYTMYGIYGDEEHRVGLWRLKDDGNDEWELVEDYGPTGHEDVCHSISCMESIGNWLAFMDEDDKSFKKMNTQDFKAHYHFIYQTQGEGNSTMYVKTFVDP